jgi:hypothetical protein
MKLAEILAGGQRRDIGRFPLLSRIYREGTSLLRWRSLCVSRSRSRISVRQDSAHPTQLITYLNYQLLIINYQLTIKGACLSNRSPTRIWTFHAPVEAPEGI